jgi:hypothetical protein
MCLESIVTDFREGISNDPVFLANCSEFELESDPLLVFCEIVTSIECVLESQEQEDQSILLPLSSLSLICLTLELNRYRYENDTTADEEQRQCALATVGILLDELDMILEQVEASL